MKDIDVSMTSDLLRIIIHWEQSGQGEGGMLDIEGGMEATEGPANHNGDDESFAMASQHASATDKVSHRGDSICSLSGRSPRALQSHAFF
jgi:hypothetical protein